MMALQDFLTVYNSGDANLDDLLKILERFSTNLACLAMVTSIAKTIVLIDTGAVPEEAIPKGIKASLQAHFKVKDDQ